MLSTYHKKTLFYSILFVGVRLGLRPQTTQCYIPCGGGAGGAVRCCAVLCGAVRCCAVLCGAVRCCAVLCGAVRCGGAVRWWCAVVVCGDVIYVC
jgi:hypothetical protein